MHHKYNKPGTEEAPVTLLIHVLLHGEVGPDHDVFLATHGYQTQSHQTASSEARALTDATSESRCRMSASHNVGKCRRDCQHWPTLRHWWRYLTSDDTRQCGRHYYDEHQHQTPAAEQPHSIAWVKANTDKHTHTHACLTATRVSWYQKGKTNLAFTEPRDTEWQWHQLGHM